MAAIGLEIKSPPRGSRADLALARPGGDVVLIDVVSAAVPTIGQLRRILGEVEPGAIPFVVADQIPSSLHDELESLGAGWLDRRGHLRLVAEGLFIDAEVPSQPRGERHAASRDPIRGRSGLAAAAALLLAPNAPGPVSEIARTAGLNPSSISRAMSALAGAQLAEQTGKGRYQPLIPELFWALADAWPRDRTIVRWKDLLGESDPLGLWPADEQIGCALAGVRGALGWGAPIVATADYPLHVYAPSVGLVRQASVLNEGGNGTEVHFTVDPTGYVTSRRYRDIDAHWWTAHPLFCALDLTAAARDREALAKWDPPEEFVRVW